MSDEQIKPKSGFKEWLDRLPLIQFLGAGIIAVASVWSTLQLSQAALAQQIEVNRQDVQSVKSRINELKELRDRQLDDIQKTMLTKSEFDAHWKQIELLRQENKETRDLIERLIESGNYQKKY